MQQAMMNLISKIPGLSNRDSIIKDISACDIDRQFLFSLSIRILELLSH